MIIKKNINKPSSIEEFIEGANKETTARKSRKRPSKENLLLVITGRTSMDEYGKPSLIYLKKNMQELIDKHCSGSRQAIINYLIQRGLNDLIEKKSLVIEDEY
jgi:hypothetical protein